ncbi:nodulation protein nolNO [Nostoc sp. FACHB-892]|uniref:carbamoyltransferase family protein n=1 Tax=Nostoc sp. FACHB-892 TaxID=2692843 RepID=UPI0016894121|nr:carbamoyltransferase C-terminal domain-containing protein [Nostoc sp. FACHB-892]MBD2730150.1 nodulation protein nolNO [Nostoc sp. FACHB-892]
MNRYYIGLASSCHDPAIAIVDSDGQIVFAEALERYLQNKRAWGAQPDDLYQIVQLVESYCDPNAEFVVANSWSSTNWQAYLKLFSTLRLRDTKSLSRSFSGVYSKEIFDWLAFIHLVGLLKAGRNFAYQMRSVFNNDNIIFKRYQHHLTHAANGCYSSPFTNAACIVVDGYGEKGSISSYSYKNGMIKTVQDCISPASLGFFYAKVTDICGFDSDKGEEWKVMGLAPYGKVDPKLYEQMRSLLEVKGCCLKQPSRHNYEKLLSSIINRALPRKASYWEAVDIACTGQKVFVDVMEELLNNFYKLNISDNLVLSGGCALNSSLNGMILEKTPFKAVYIPSAPADDGNAVGAGLLAYYEDHPHKFSQKTWQSPYLGSTISKKSLDNMLRFSQIKNLRHLPGTVHLEAARLLSEGKLIGWVQGRAEFGPRALGNRSILADPRSPNMKNIINERVKFREEYRPLAPSILHEFGDKYFENYQESPYMERTLRWRPEVKEQVPAVVHANDTGRLQTVKQEWNEKFYSLINAFYEITGVPIILNTSLNVMGKPIIHSLEDALSVFYTVGLDALIIEDYILEK